MTLENWAAGYTARIVANVKKEREAQNLTAKQLSEACERVGNPLGRDVIANLESGRRGSLSVTELLTFAAALQLPAISLLFPPLRAGSGIDALPGVELSNYEAMQQFDGIEPRNIEGSPNEETLKALLFLRTIQDSEAAILDSLDEQEALRFDLPDDAFLKIYGKSKSAQRTEFNAIVRYHLEHSHGIRQRLVEMTPEAQPPIPVRLVGLYAALEDGIPPKHPRAKTSVLADGHG